ncbi:cytochrome P450 [Nemania sp. FL0031]|nr:cytochrome P450 [Nemania sp. FL0031]
MGFTALFVRLVVTSALSWTVYSWICLWQNYQSARKLGVPLRILPISHGNPLWMLVDKRVVPLARRFLGDCSFTRYNWRGWEVDDKCRSHIEMGDVYMQVTPGKNWLYVCNPESLLDVFRRRSDFPRPLEIYQMLNVFGPNLSTVEGDQWKQQRKITAPCFNDLTNEVVWTESLSLATDMLRYWSDKTSVSTTAEDVRTLSLHVLAKAGFGQSFPFQGHDASVSAASPATSYKESLKEVLDNCILIMILGTNFLSMPWLPRKLRRVHEACVSFQKHMENVYEKEKYELAKGKPAERNLLSSLIRESNKEEAKDSVVSTDARAFAGLTDSEIYGNMFVFNFAGHDTTAHSLMFSVAFLAANPFVQDWLSEELKQVLGDRQPKDWDYHKDFPQLKRCNAVLMETVRLYTPVPVAKWTERTGHQLQVGDKTITVPPDTMVIPSYAALHTHPEFWGPDPLTWRPQRWIEKRDSIEELVTLKRGTFIPWSEGERSCPGKKFSQVEFVATMAVLFRDWQVMPELMRGETSEKARARLLNLIETDSAQKLLLQMLHPERAPLVWKKR